MTNELEENWIEFKGEVVEVAPAGEHVIVAPANDPDLHLTFLLSDVSILETGEAVFLKLGCRIQKLNKRTGSEYNKRPYGAKSSKCENGSMCLGNVEFCCDTQACVGPCHGYWRCP